MFEISGEKSFYVMGSLYDDHKNNDDDPVISILDFAKNKSSEVGTDSDDEPEYDEDGNVVKKVTSSLLTNSVFPG